LLQQIKNHIKTDLSPRHVPYQIICTPDIPYTVNGKKMELAVKNAVNKKPVKMSNTIANPESILFYQTWAQSNT